MAKFSTSRYAKPALLTLVGIVLFVFGSFTVLYSAWFQDMLRVHLVEYMNRRPDTRFSLDGLRITLPLSLNLDGLVWIERGDTTVAAGALTGNVRPLSLLEGRVELDRARLLRGRYNMGNADSATIIRIAGDTILLDDASVRLSDMAIKANDGLIAGGSLKLWINPDPPVDSTPSQPTRMNIAVKHLKVRDLRFGMNLMPTIDTLDVHIDEGDIRDIAVDLYKQTVDVGTFKGHGLAATYIVPDSAQILATKVAPPAPSSSAPWTVRVGHISFDRSSGLYTTHGLKPLPGFDPAYIQATDLTLVSDNFYNRATDVNIPLKVTGTERCGVQLDVAGTLAIDSIGLTFDDVSLATANGTDLKGKGYLQMGDMATDPDLRVRLDATGKFAVADAQLMFPVLKPYLAPAGEDSAIDFGTAIDGTMGQLNINGLDLSLPGVIELSGSGLLSSVMNPAKMEGDLSLTGHIGDVHPWLSMLMPGSGIAVPMMDARADMMFGNGTYSGTLTATTAEGDLRLDGTLVGRGPEYNIDLITNAFPVQAFMPGAGVGEVTAHIEGEGYGLDLFSKATRANVSADITSLRYQGVTYRDISGKVMLEDGHGDITLDSRNVGLNFALDATATVDGDKFEIDGTFNSRRIDLYDLKMSTTPAAVMFGADLDASFNKSLTDIAATLRLDTLKYSYATGEMHVSDIVARLNSVDSVTNASIRNRDMFAFFSTPMLLMPFVDSLARVTPVMDRLNAEHKISVTELQAALPPFNLAISGGNNNMVGRILAGSEMSLSNFSVNASNDSLINFDARVLGFNSPTIRLDTLTLDMRQHGRRLDIQGRLDNRPGTFDSWAHARLDGFFDTDRLGLNLEQQNIQGKTGFDIGAGISLSGDSTATLTLDKLDPIIGYSPWTVNEGNYVTYNFKKRHIDADLHMAGAGSKVAIYSEAAHSHDPGMHTADEDLVVQISDLRLQDWITINPFAPAIRGNLGTDLRVNLQDGSISGEGDITLGNLYYGKERVGDLKAELDVQTGRSGRVSADMALWVNGTKSMTLKGDLNDSTRTSPFNLDLNMIHFPLSTANAFLPGVAKLKGDIDGSMTVEGDMAKPILNGWLAFDSAAVTVDMLGSTLELPGEHIPVENNIVRLNNLKIKACNDNPLTVAGTVDLSELSSPGIDLSFNASNMQLVNTVKAPRGADVFGKLFLGLNATARGNLDFLTVKAKADILPGTNVTYIMPEAASTLQNQSKGSMVKFVNFADSAQMAHADSLERPSTLMLNLDAKLNISNSVAITADLGSMGRVQLQPEGGVHYTMSPVNSGRMTGRININGGYARVSPPALGEKLFNFNQGSYVTFSGNMMNPLLNIRATDRVRANVTSTGQNSRLIYFDIGLSVTGSFNDMKVAFDLSTDDDATVANELATMSPQQRESAAMNMLVTNIYASGDTKADASMGGNALYSFLTSQLNSWAANNIRAVDISFGINQYDNVRGGASQQATSYSYQISKSLFNDRFKIVVGGNYTTDADPNQNLEQNLISDVSLEYMLNDTGTKVIRVFRHTGFESILEGEITEMGVGFTYRRKLNSLRPYFDFLFPSRRRARKAIEKAEAEEKAKAEAQEKAGAEARKEAERQEFKVNLPPENSPSDDNTK